MSVDLSERPDNLAACHEMLRAGQQVIEEYRRQIQESERERVQLIRKYRARRKQLLAKRRRESR